MNFDIAFDEVDVKRRPRDHKGAEGLEFPFHSLTKKIYVYKCGSTVQIPIRVVISKHFKTTLTTYLDVEQLHLNQKNTFGILQRYLQNLNFQESFTDYAIS